ncbi:minor extracellular protease vpr [Magnaporthiopsis poae ATCC 64411]|uniref:Minor extracellular protease vpr n=1 Tax=Magnaporthiopsis poae (strain ATCC 64411 / 73-15) TaxID=644358 RepID=A0A0C4DPP3_MAGP6|nr:minor extracellular protease vpr [Magnaporthiopsis poae ATCC 64411]
MVAWSSLAPLVGLTLSAVAGVSAAQDAPAEPSTKKTTRFGDVPGAFIVEFEGDYDADALVNDLRGEKLDAEKRLNLKYKLFNGASVNVNATGDAAETAAKLAGHQKVKRVWPVRKVSMPMDRIQSVGGGAARAQAEMMARRGNTAYYNSSYSTHVMGQVQKLHAEGFTGKGIRISIVDSGVDYTHPDLGGCFGPGCKVSYGYDLIGDDLANFPKPDPDPMEACFGHGTHISGIIGANSNYLGFQGVAPDAELGMFRALTCLGGSSNEILMAAFNMAFDAGSDIITSSTGILGGWEDDPWSLTATRIAAAGVPILIAAGNDGENGMAQSSNPAAGRGVASVASVDNTDIPRVFPAGSYQVDGSDGAEQFPYQTAAYVPMGNLTLPLVIVKDQSGAMLDACDALPDSVPSLDGVIALIGAGSCTIAEASVNVVAKGGKHMIQAYSDDSPPPFWFPEDFGMLGVATTTASQGKKWAATFAAGHNITVTTRDTDKSPNLVTHTPATVSGGYVSDWSTWGPLLADGRQPQPGRSRRRDPLHVPAGRRHVRRHVGHVHGHALRCRRRCPSDAEARRARRRDYARPPR